MKNAAIIVGGLLLLGASVFAGVKFMGSQGDESVRSQETASEKEAESSSDEITVYPLDTFIVNLDGEGGRRYLKLKMTLEVDGSMKERLDSQLHRIRDSILILLTSKTFEDLRGAEGKYAMREEVKRRIGRIAGKGVVKDVFLEEFVIQ